MNTPTTEVVLKAVCDQINEIGSELYKCSTKIQKTIPVSSRDIMTAPSKHRSSSDARVIAAIILRKHVLIPYDLQMMRAPTMNSITASLKTSHRLSSLMRRMCERMRKEPLYRRVYVHAVRDIIGKGYELDRADNIESVAPCQ